MNVPLDVLLLTAKQLYDIAQADLDPSFQITWIQDRVLNPRPGDWVAEVTRGLSKLEPCAVGRLILMRVEPCAGDWGDEPTPTEEIWYIESVEGTLVRWRECQFMALPDFLNPREPDLSGEKALWVAQAIERYKLNQG